MHLPIISEFLDWIKTPATFERFMQFSLVFGVVMMVVATFKPNSPFPYGKTYTKGTSVLKFEVKDRIAVILSNLPGPIIFLLAFIQWPNARWGISSLLYIGHYIHRALIYPFFRSELSKPWPLESVIYYAVTNFIVGITFAHGLVFNFTDRNMVIQIVVAILFVACAIGAALHDYKLCKLRQAGDNGGYKIPNGLLFKWISGPNYLLEFVQWMVFLVFLPWGFSMAVCAIWVMVNVTGRAEANHDAYVKKLFKKKYPEDRCPYIPGIKNSRYII